LTPLSTIFQLYRGGQFYWWRKPEYPEKTTEITEIALYVALSTITLAITPKLLNRNMSIQC